MEVDNLPDERSYYEAFRHWTTTDSWKQAKRQYAYNYAAILPQHSTARILDLGCSEGIALEWLVDQGYENIVGVDSDEVAVERARDCLRGRLPEKQIIPADLYEYLREQEDCSVDRIFMFNVVEHLEKSLLLKVFTEVHRLLKPEGALLAQTGNIENPFNLGLFTRDFTHQIPFSTYSLWQATIICGFDPERARVNAVRYKTTLRNWPFQLTSFTLGRAVRGLAFAMRTRIQETSPLIYCVAWK